MKRIIILSATLLLLVSCSDFLNIRPEGTNPSEGMDYTKSENVFKPVSAAYSVLRSYDLIGFPYICVQEITSDDADKGSTPDDNPDANSLDLFTVNDINPLVNSQWVGFFNLISAANNAIYQMSLFKKSTENSQTLSDIRVCEADARFLRGIAYYYLVRLFGGVPIVDKVMTAEELAGLERPTTAKVWEFLEADLQDAIDNLPASWSKVFAGRATKYTAMAYKAKAHLYQGEYAECAALCDEIIADKAYSLMSDFRHVFSMEGELCKESVFEVQVSELGVNTGDDIPYSEHAFVQGPRNNTPTNMQGWGFCTPSEDLIAFFNARGEVIRPATTLLYAGSTTPEGDYIQPTCTNPVYNGKVYTPSSYNIWRFNGYGFGHNIRLMRYPDVLLMYAECLARGIQAPGKSGYTAADALNEVRSRAGLSETEATLDAVLDERRAEFALEEDRFLDLVRTGRAASVLASKGFTAGKNELFPIPSSQRQLNTHLDQNPRY